MPSRHKNRKQQWETRKDRFSNEEMENGAKLIH
jgi:hypothetical protein